MNANIRIDGTIDVNEKIDVYFYQSMHGIERFFPKYYEVGDLEFQIFYDNIKVNNDNYEIYLPATLSKTIIPLSYHTIVNVTENFLLSF